MFLKGGTQNFVFRLLTLHEKCPNTELFLVCIYLYSNRIRKFIMQISVFSPNTGNYGPEIARYLELFGPFSRSVI